MRLTRRGALAGLATAAFAAPATAQAPGSPAASRSRFQPGRSRAFEPRSPDKTRFGELIFRGGLVLTGNHPRFGGLSGLWRSPDGRDLVAVTDNGFWLTARPA